MNITMNEISQLFGPFLAGLILGLVYFGGLWFTVKRTIANEHSHFWLLPSLFLRMAIVLLGFYFVSQGKLLNLLVCFCAFLLVRIVLVRRLRPSRNQPGAKIPSL